MQTTRDPLDKLMDALDSAAGEARRAGVAYHESGHKDAEALADATYGALVELRMTVANRTTEAADVVKPFDGGSLQRVGRLRARWLVEAAQLESAGMAARRVRPDAALKAEAGALVYRTCADTLDIALYKGPAGTEPTDGTHRRAEDKL